MIRFVTKVMLLLLIVTLAAGQSQKTYVDPDGAFALLIPSHWQANRTVILEVIWYTQLGTGNPAEARIEFLVMPDEEGLTPDMLDEVGGSMLELLFELINANGAVLSQNTSKSKVGPQSVIKCDITYQDASEGMTRKGTVIVAIGRKNALLALVSTPQNAAAELPKAEQFLSTIAVESRTPLTVVTTPSQQVSKSSYTAAMLKRTAQKIRENLRREAPESVLVSGNPPLTHSSVANFVKLICDAFSIEFTELEFEMTKERFIEYYKKADSQGKTQIALGAANILSQLQQGTPEQQAANRKEVREALEKRFAAGAQAGIEWAQVLYEAITRRNTTLKTVSAAPPAKMKTAKLDNTFTEADLNASLEMLYFWWVASGRDPALVTAEAVAQVSQYLAVNFLRFSPTLQYLLANAEHFYGQMRMAWQQDNDQTRLLMAQQFSQALDEMGLTVPQRTGGRSAWDDVAGKDPSSIKAELAMSYAGSAATSSSFSGRTLTW